MTEEQNQDETPVDEQITAEVTSETAESKTETEETPATSEAGTSEVPGTSESSGAAETQETVTNEAGKMASSVEDTDPFKRHHFLSYQGYSFPWYIALIWIIFLTSGVAYLIFNILLDT